MKNTETKHHIEIEGVILTEDALSELRAMQANDNDFLNCTRESVADVVCFLAKCMDCMEKTDNEEITTLMATLSRLRTYLNRFRKP